MLSPHILPVRRRSPPPAVDRNITRRRLPVPAILGDALTGFRVFRQSALPILGLHPLARFGIHPVVGTEAACVTRRVRITGWPKRFEPEVSPYPILEFRRYGLFVAEVWSVFDGLRLRGDLDQAPPVVDPDDLGRHEGGVCPEETHLYSDVSHRVPLVDEDIVHLADPLVVGVVDAVLFSAALESSEEILPAFSVHSSSFRETVAFTSSDKARRLPYSIDGSRCSSVTRGTSITEHDRKPYHLTELGRSAYVLPTPETF